MYALCKSVPWMPQKLYLLKPGTTQNKPERHAATHPQQARTIYLVLARTDKLQRNRSFSFPLFLFYSQNISILMISFVCKCHNVFYYKAISTYMQINSLLLNIQRKFFFISSCNGFFKINSEQNLCYKAHVKKLCELRFWVSCLFFFGLLHFLFENISSHFEQMFSYFP